MKLIKPSYKIRTKFNTKEVLSDIIDNGIEILKDIEDAGRTCYKSENKITNESAPKFIKMLLDKGHESVLEHQIISVRFVCDRGVSHELVRHRIAAHSQESTRYCNYSKDKFDNQLTFIIPCWVENIPEGEYKLKIEDKRLYSDKFDNNRDDINSMWFWSLANNEITYNKLIEDGWQPQQARAILPNSLKTEICTTANLREWRTIFKQRTSKAAHPQMRELMCPLLDELKTKLPVIFDDINY